MNWTGGRLQRHSRNSAGKSLTNIQKQHFAKVRTRLQNGPKAPSPPDISLQHASLDQYERRSRQGYDDRGKHPKRQRTLSESTATSALVNRLNSIKTRQISHDQGTTSKLRHDEKRSSVADVGDFTRPAHGFSTRHTPTNRPELLARGSQNDHFVASDEGKLSSEPHGRMRESFSTTLAGNNTWKLTQQGSLEDKRQSLLRQGDWVGTALTRPLKMSFPASNDKNRIGRRRKLSEQDRIRQAARPRQIYQPLRKEMLLPSRREWEDSGGREDISIRIGGQIHGSQRTAVHGAKEETFTSQDYSMSSGSMLLDREDTSFAVPCQKEPSRPMGPHGAEGQQWFSEDALWPSRTSLASPSIRSESPSTKSDHTAVPEKLSQQAGNGLDDENTLDNRELSSHLPLEQSEDAEQHPRVYPKQRRQHHQRTNHNSAPLTTDPSALARRNSKGDVESRRKNKHTPEWIDNKYASESAHPAPLRLIFDSTPPSIITAQASHNEGKRNKSTQSVRSTVVEASSDALDAIIKDSDELGWAKLVDFDNCPDVGVYRGAPLSVANDSVGLGGLQASDINVPITPSLGTDESLQSQPSTERVDVGEQRTAVTVSDGPPTHIERVQTEDEIWMKFLDIGSDTEESEEVNNLRGVRSLEQIDRVNEPRSLTPYRRAVIESTITQAPTTSYTRADAETSSLSYAHFESDTAGNIPAQTTAQALSTSADSPAISMLATASSSLPDQLSLHNHTSPETTAGTVWSLSSDPLAACTSLTPSIAAATQHSSFPRFDFSSSSIAPPKLNKGSSQVAETSSPDPLTLATPSMLLAHHHHNQPPIHTAPRPPRVVFTKPTPFSGRHASTAAIHRTAALQEPPRLGRTFTGASSRARSSLRLSRATSKLGTQKGKGKGRGRGAGPPAARSIYSIPSTDSEIEDFSGDGYCVESIDDESDTDS
ncbi:hypothetical protein MMC16_007569 [Acarospora aff. strigata]|nr:hypothetical protein [Acarospora aff. strigata]